MDQATLRFASSTVFYAIIGGIMDSKARPLHKQLNDFIKWFYSRVLRFWRDFEVLVLIVIGATAALCGLMGYNEYFSQYSLANNLSPPYSYVESLYRTALLFKATINITGHLNLWLEIARWLALILLFYAVLKGVMELFYKQINLQILKLFIKSPVVIVGYREESILLAKDFTKNDNKVVIVDNDVSKADQQKCRELGIILVDKNPVEKDALQKAQVHKAKYIINIMENDGKNVEAAVSAFQMKWDSRNTSTLPCYIHISDRQLQNQLEMQKSDYDTSRFTFEYFNMYDNAARALLNKYPIFIDQFTGPKKPPHVLIVGSDRLSESLIIHSIRTWMPQYLKNNKKMQITLVAKNATLMINLLTVRYPNIVQLCDFYRVNMDFNRSDLQPLYLSRIKDEKMVRFDAITSVYVCLNDDAANLSAALGFYEQLLVPDTAIVTCMYRDGGLASLLRWEHKKEGTMKNLHAFGLIDNACRSDIIVGGVKKKLDKSIIPQAMYEYYVNKQVASGAIAASAVIPWNNLPEEEVEKNRRSANALVERLAYAGYEIAPLNNRYYQFIKMADEDIDKLAEWEHRRWYEELKRAGWSLGPVKDQEKKTNPNFRFWTELSQGMKEYNLNAASEIPMFLFVTGFQMVKKKGNSSSVSKQSPLLTVKAN